MNEEYTPTEREVENGQKVFDILATIPEISAQKVRDDLLVVSEAETQIEVIVDAEETVIVLFVPVMDTPKERQEALFHKLLIANNHIVHGAFCIDEEDDKIIIKENLEAENLDPNELVAAITSLIYMVESYADELAAFSPGA